MVKVILYKDDLPNDVILGKSIAIDTEAMGLNPHRDRLCLIQITDGSGIIYLVQISKNPSVLKSPNLVKILSDDKYEKIFHYARFDVGILQFTFKISIKNIFCTKIAARIALTFSRHHGLKSLCSDLLGIEISKKQQTSDWGSDILTNDQCDYAATDVQYLHRLKEILENRLIREERFDIAKKCFDFIPTRAEMDLYGFSEEILLY